MVHLSRCLVSRRARRDSGPEVPGSRASGAPATGWRGRHATAPAARRAAGPLRRSPRALVRRRAGPGPILPAAWRLIDEQRAGADQAGERDQQGEQYHLAARGRGVHRPLLPVLVAAVYAPSMRARPPPVHEEATHSPTHLLAHSRRRDIMGGQTAGPRMDGSMATAGGSAFSVLLQRHRRAAGLTQEALPSGPG